MAEKVRQTDPPREAPRSSPSPSGRLIPPQKVGEKSGFQKLFEEVRQTREEEISTGGGDHRPPSAAELKEAVRPASSQQERAAKDRDDPRKRFDKDSDHERSDGKGRSSSGDSVSRAKEAEHRVIGRASVSERRSHGEGKGSAGQGGPGTGGQGRRGRAEAAFLTGSSAKKIGGNALSRMDAFQTLLESVSGRSLPRADKASKLPPIFNKALLDQIVRYCRVVTKTDGEKEIELELNEKIFQGLRLRVSSKDGEMLATFETRSPEAHALFQAHKNDLKQVLQEKGIAVRSINVIMV